MLPRPTSHSKALGPGVAGPELAVATSAVLDAPPRPTPQQPLSGAENFMVDPVALDSAGPRQHTQYPYVTGTSVLAIKYKDGVMVACDTLGAYGSTKRYKSVERIKRINDHVVVAASGELSDFQYIIKLLDELTTGVCCVCPCMRCFRVVHVCVCVPCKACVAIDNSTSFPLGQQDPGVTIHQAAAVLPMHGSCYCSANAGAAHTQDTCRCNISCRPSSSSRLAKTVPPTG